LCSEPTSPWWWGLSRDVPGHARAKYRRLPPDDVAIAPSTLVVRSTTTLSPLLKGKSEVLAAGLRKLMYALFGPSFTTRTWPAGNPKSTAPSLAVADGVRLPLACEARMIGLVVSYS